MMAIRKLEERLITRLVIGLHWEDNWFALGGHGLCQQDNYFYTACIQSTPHGTTMHKVKKVCVCITYPKSQQLLPSFEFLLSLQVSKKPLVCLQEYIAAAYTLSSIFVLFPMYICLSSNLFYFKYVLCLSIYSPKLPIYSVVQVNLQ